MAEKRFGVGLERAKHQGRQLLRPELAAPDGPCSATLRSVPIQRLKAMAVAAGAVAARSPRRLAHQRAALRVDADRRGCQQLTQGVGNQPSLPILKAADQAVGRAQINADDGVATRLSWREKMPQLSA